MSKLESLQLEYLIREKIEKEHWTHDDLSIFLKEQYPGMRGVSVRSLERFCSSKGISKTARVNTERLDEAVSDAVAKVWMLIVMVHFQSGNLA